MMDSVFFSGGQAALQQQQQQQQGVLVHKATISEGQREYEVAQLQGEINADKQEIKESEVLLKHMTGILANKEPMSQVALGPYQETDRARHYSNLEEEYRVRSSGKCEESFSHDPVRSHVVPKKKNQV